MPMKKQEKLAAQALLEKKKQGGRTRAFFNTGTRWMQDSSKYSRKKKHRRQDEAEGAFFMKFCLLCIAAFSFIIEADKKLHGRN
jgi:uncharacterized membrane-anchored protein